MERSYGFSINYLKIKGLYDHELELDFTNTSNVNPMYFIGKNGCYKSTVLEIIYSIFASFDAPSVIRQYGIDYVLEYTIDYNKVVVRKYNEEYNLLIRSGGNRDFILEGRKIDTIRKYLKNYLPNRIISFYAGENDRIKKINRAALRGYDSQLTKELNRFIESQVSSNEFVIPKRRYFHGNDDLIPLLLVAAVNNRKAKKIVSEVCQVESLDRITFYTDFTLISNKKKISLSEAQRLFSRFFSKINQCIRITKDDSKEWNDRYSITYNFNNNADDYYVDLLYEFYDFLTYEFKGDIFTYVRTSEGVINDIHLSQGQRQWAKIIGLLSLVNDTQNMVLMDEPDAYMNPVWKYEFDKNIREIIGGGAPGANIIVTHDPLLINGVPKEQIRIFERTPEEVVVREPITDTYGLGIDGILRSSYYGLTTTFDQRTSEKYYRRMKLFSKAINNELQDKKEKRELFELTKELGGLPAFNSSIDYLYLDFLKIYKESEYASKEYLTEDEITKREETIKGILDSLYRENDI